MPNQGTNPRFATVGMASVLIAEAQKGRKRILFCQTTGNVICISKRNPAVLNSGIPLTALGSSYEEVAKGDVEIWEGEYYAIASAGASNLAISEDW